jgi:hypothetical protein
MDLLTGAANKRQAEIQQQSIQQNADQIAASQRTSLAQIAAEQGQLDQAAATGNRRKRGSGLLKFITDTAGQASLG